MATGPMTNVIRQLRRAALGQGGVQTDGQLLERFLACREEEAFEALVRRHGPMVLAVCRRVLRHAQDAEDAFQATFLVLVRKAGSIFPRNRVGNWLYGVAYRTALKAKAMNARRRLQEGRVPPRKEAAGQAPDLWEDLQPVLDQELNGLPEKYRALIVLCDLESRPRKEAARHLGLPEGTVSSRLARARALLARRLRRHRPGVSAGLLTALLAREAAAGPLPGALATNTVQAALAGAIPARVAALAEGVVRAMLLTKLKVALILLTAAGLVGLGALGVTRSALADKAPTRNPSKTDGGKFQKKTDPEEVGRHAQGVVRAVDAAQKTITILRGKKGEQTFPLGPKVRVSWPEGKKGQEHQVGEVKEGMDVVLRLAADRKTVQGITVQLPSLVGSIKALDPARRTLTLASKGKEGAREHTFALGPDASISLPDFKKGQRGKLSDLAPGQMVSVQLSLDRTTARGIQVHRPGINGTVKAMDAAGGTITLAYKDQGGAHEKTFELAKDARVGIADIREKKGSLADLSDGVPVTAELSLDRKKVVALWVQGRALNGTLKGVDTGINAITVTVKENASVVDKTIDVHPKAQITLTAGNKTQRVQLTDLVQGTPVQVRLSADQKKAIAIHAIQKD